jgi:hypothetical protein
VLGFIPELFEVSLLILETRYFRFFELCFFAPACLHKSAYLFTGGVADLVDAIAFAYNAATLCVQLDKFFNDFRREIAVPERFPDLIQIFPNKIKV